MKAHLIVLSSIAVLSSGVTDASEESDPFAEGKHEVVMPATPDHLVPLDPYPGDWRKPYSKQLTKHLGLEADYVARMMVRPSFDAEYLMRISGDAKGHGYQESKEFTVSCVVSNKSIWYSMPENNSEKIQKPINPESFRAPIPADIARRVCALWEEMIFRTRYSRECSTGFDGVTIEFASGYGHGETWCPTEGTSPALLWDLGECLIKYCKATQDERKPLLVAVEKSAIKLEAHLKKHAEAGTGRPAPVLGPKADGKDKPRHESKPASQ